MRFHDNSVCLVRAGVCLIESRGRSSNSSWDLETRKWWGCCDNVSQAVSHVSCNEYIMRVSLPRPVPPSHGDEIQHCLRAADLISLETLTMLLLRNGSWERQHNSTECFFSLSTVCILCLFQFLQGVSCRRTETCLFPCCPILSSDSGAKKTLANTSWLWTEKLNVSSENNKTVRTRNWCTVRKPT